MNKIKLVDWQVKSVRDWLDNSSVQVEDALLDKYAAYCVEDLPASKYDDIIYDIMQLVKSVAKKSQKKKKHFVAHEFVGPNMKQIDGI